MKKEFLACLMLSSISALTSGQPFSNQKVISQKPGLDGISSFEERFAPYHPMGRFPEKIAGDVVYKSPFNPDRWFATSVGDVNLGLLASMDDSFEMLAFGGGLTAGVSNGGLNREGQAFAYPNLVAHQMGLKNFKTPLLDAHEANGLGILVYDDSVGDYPRWNRAINEVVPVKSSAEQIFTPFRGQISNYGFPNGGTLGLDSPSPYLKRILDRSGKPLTLGVDIINENHKYDFAILEDFFDSWILSIIYQDRIDFRHLNGPIIHTGAVPLYGADQISHSGKTKGVIFTIPHYKDLLFMKWYSVEKLKSLVPKFSLNFVKDGQINTLNEESKFLLKPTARVDSLFSNLERGEVLNAQLSDDDVIDESEMWFANPDTQYNPKILELSKARNLALVDLRSLFEKVSQGQYKTDDGLVIDGTTKGNFFSSDGIYPSPIGQAVIANEVIKSINSKYRANIPLINVAEYARIISIK